MFPVPLPPNPFLKPSELYTAYQRCLALEAATSGASRPHGPPPIVCARLLGHLLRLAPPGNGQGRVQRKITLAADDVKLMELASFYLSHFICPCKPPPTCHFAVTYWRVFSQLNVVEYQRLHHLSTPLACRLKMFGNIPRL
ncbi:hypothetical protein PISMIDRAFT_272054 [Pisolithus microcarpus 441]|uniref:Uncharacterized protein n=1 Tax=Pisolithus microcarpus 441 TaxID=765257 RepID=A0A0C9ZK39_9AGAM|nr:hypothetical protein PISMIDRAFT_272054 [Pisolithus microcarpus 441]